MTGILGGLVGSAVGASAIATGGVVTTSGAYTYHRFSSGGTFQVVNGVGKTFEVLAIGKSGSRGTNTTSSATAGGGPGAGDVASSSFQLANGQYTVTIATIFGGSSNFGGLLTAGGGGNGGRSTAAATSGAGGGGGGAGSATTSLRTGAAGNTNSNAFGFNGGNGSPRFDLNDDGAVQYSVGGGGGGAGSAGSNGTGSSGSNATGGRGGDGTSAFSEWGFATNTGEPNNGLRWYAGGGGGNAVFQEDTLGRVVVTPGAAGFGAFAPGGGGSAPGSSLTPNGLVIIRYLT